MEINVATFNIQHGKDYLHFRATGEERIDLKRMAETVRTMQVDLCGLNEVRRQTGEGLCDQAEVIARHLGWNYAFTPAIPIKNGTYGNALVSRFPITSLRQVPIITLPEERGPESSYENRVLLIATVDAEGTEITVMSCHFGLNGPEMNKAAQTVLQEAEKVNTPLLFMGDLNLSPDTEIIRTLAKRFTDSATVSEDSMLTFPSDLPKKKIDYIFGKGCKFLSAQVPALVASDHLPVKATVQI